MQQEQKQIAGEESPQTIGRQSLDLDKQVRVALNSAKVARAYEWELAMEEE